MLLVLIRAAVHRCVWLCVYKIFCCARVYSSAFTRYLHRLCPEMSDITTKHEDDGVDDSMQDQVLQSTTSTSGPSCCHFPVKRNQMRQSGRCKVKRKHAPKNCSLASHHVVDSDKPLNEHCMTKMLQCRHVKHRRQYTCARTRAVDERYIVGRSRQSRLSETADDGTEVSGVEDIATSLPATEVYPCLDHSYFCRDLEPGSENITKMGSLREMCSITKCTGEQPCQCEDDSSRILSTSSNLKYYLKVRGGKQLYCCNICSRQFARPDHVENHMRFHRRKESSQCASSSTKTLTTSSNVVYHVQYCKGKKLFSCNFCGKNFRTPRDVERHMRTHTGERPFGCTVCGKKFGDSSVLKKHMRRHSNERPFFCDVCGKSFFCKSSLQQHSEIHSVGRQLLCCKICSKIFSNSHSLRQHLRRHTAARQFGCNYCDKKFYEKGNLKKHTFTHTGERPYECIVCSKTFTNSRVLKTHMLVHTGERPFCCAVCSKKFRDSWTLKIHMRCHTGERPYGCELCAKKFAQFHALTRHMLVHTGERPFECGDCGLRFMRLDELKTHMRRHTRE